VHDHARPHVEQIAITESPHDQTHGETTEAQDAPPDEAMVATTTGFATEPDEGPEEPRREERRRRRGRRGGRRNRQRNDEGGYTGADQSAHYAQQAFAPAEQLIAPAATEPALSHAVADLDSPPSERADPPDMSPALSPGQPEAGRRRSTIREAPPTAGGEAERNDPAAPAPSQGAEPVITETGDAAEGERPRRTGWWSRRFAGG
jgi:ribonuclease E